MARTYYVLRPTDVGVVYVTDDMDATANLNLATPVAEGAVLTNLVGQAWRFPDASEPADAMIAASELTVTVGSPVGNVVPVRVSGFGKGRVYRVEVIYGPAANKRANGIVFDCSE